ncbi:MAG: UDP-N-acetylmuramoyl-L-alanyl-D-glutamate--2,6-diaminopimelate ligase [Caldilineae bacterium]|nr:UDP-N-acetylmuramoyl-L-alanyl-D-glutamate--2,6-diaminopimelate ligase [Chloroflexota bacterium]MCB9176127.1 UDP-N-acetylmuramoyl-L-alanyl-D-glutamate--2,6-diaminopimelate ligase [Caldilineae bacterium]
MPGATLAALLADVEILEAVGDLEVSITSITHDSRLAGPGTLFVAYRGVNLDVHRYLPDAFARGAAAALVERPVAELRRELQLPGEAVLVRVPEVRRARALVASALFGHPSRDMIVVGVTGTDGKTTTCTLIHAMLTAAGRRVGLISTVAAQVGQEALDTGLHVTTPEAEDVQRYLDLMRAAGTEIAVLETTSHGLHQHRVTGVAFDLAVLTNITHEALEYHGSFEAYREAKAKLFRMVSAADGKAGVEPCAVLNADDPSYARFASIPVARRLSYGLDTAADLRAEAIESGPEGLRFRALTPAGSVEIRSRLGGRYNAANILAAMAAAQALGAPLDALAAGAVGLAGVPGRMESVDVGQPFHAIVDFAHTPNALDAALAAARDLTGPGGRVIAVFGCAGLRDPSKRAAMGRVAARRAELSLVTAEDPRTEDLDAIIEAVARGFLAEGAHELPGLGPLPDRAPTDGAPSPRRPAFRREPDRFEAIRLACAAARDGDVLMLCGKGHEQSLCIGEVEHPWDDRLALRAALLGQGRDALPGPPPPSPSA